MVIPDSILNLEIPDEIGDSRPLKVVLAELTEGEEILNAQYRIDGLYIESFQCYTKSFVITQIVTGHEHFLFKTKRNY